MKARLVVIESQSTDRKVVYSELPVTIGRGPDAGVRLADSFVSRCHCEIAEVGGTLVVRDLGSKHGTLVNRQSILESALLPGVEILVGLTSLRASFNDEFYADHWLNEPSMA